VSPTGKIVETRVNRIWLDDEGILRVENLPGAELTLEDAQASSRASAEITAGRTVPVLVDMRESRSITREARLHFANDPLIRAQALLVGSRTSKVLGEFFIRLSRATCPVRVFTSEPEALDWLRGFVESPDKG